MRALAQIFAGSLATLLLLWLMWPAPISPQPWDEPAAPSLTGPLARDNRLDTATVLAPSHPGLGEDIAVNSDGSVYVTSSQGGVYQVDTRTGASTPVAVFPGHPTMGLYWLDDTMLGVATVSGLYGVDVETGLVTTLSAGYLARPLGFVNDLTRTEDGQIYFTDSSSRWGHGSERPGYLYDMLENRPYGALYRYDPSSGTTHLVVERLYYPNGVIAVEDGDALLVTESFRYRIRKVWIRGPRAGEIDTFMENMPGMPDGMRFGPDGRLYIAMAAYRSDTLSLLRPRPWLTQLLLKLPAWMRPSGTTAGFIVVVDPDTGTYLDSLHSETGHFGNLSNIDFTPAGDLIFGAAHNGLIARLPRAAVERSGGAAPQLSAPE